MTPFRTSAERGGDVIPTQVTPPGPVSTPRSAASRVWRRLASRSARHCLALCPMSLGPARPLFPRPVCVFVARATLSGRRCLSEARAGDRVSAEARWQSRRYPSPPVGPAGIAIWDLPVRWGHGDGRRLAGLGGHWEDRRGAGEVVSSGSSPTPRWEGRPVGMWNGFITIVH